MNEAQIRRDLVRYSHAMHAAGWVANHDGNLSARLGADRRHLVLAPLIMGLRQHGVVAVAINNQTHLPSPPFNVRQSLARPAISRWRFTIPDVISGSTPSSSSVRALSAISAARRRPWVVIRSIL